MLIDTHAHIYLDQFDNDLDEVLDRARESGVTKIVMPAIDLASIEAALILADRHEGLYVMAALHPSETSNATDEDFGEVVRLCAEDRVVAVGESGLDYYWDRSFDDRQKTFFRRHIRLALEMDLPLVIHNREAGDDILAILSEELEAAGQRKMQGVFHCYGGPIALGNKAIDLGFHLGIGGTYTFKNGGVPASLEGIGLEHLVLETDSPFLSPVPFRGKRNEPAHVALVARRLAEDRGLDVKAVEDETTANALALFDLP